MPVHAVLLISVKIAKQGVEGVASVLFNLVLQREQHRMPLQSTGQEKGQTVYMRYKVAVTGKNRKCKISHAINRGLE